MELYMHRDPAAANPPEEYDGWNKHRWAIIEMLVEKLLLKELIKELKEEIKEEAEAYVIAKCKETYRKLLMTGPFTTRDSYDDRNYHDSQQVEETKGSSSRRTNVIKDRERNVVMGAIMHQIDANNYVVTVAVIDKYGELIQTRDFMRLLPLRPRPQRRDEHGKPVEEPPKKEPVELRNDEKLNEPPFYSAEDLH